MSLYKHCDNCDAHIKISDWSNMAVDRWIKVDEPDLHFCSWNCVHEFAEKKLRVPLRG